jgi:hypothetical protein
LLWLCEIQLFHIVVLMLIVVELKRWKTQLFHSRTLKTKLKWKKQQKFQTNLNRGLVQLFVISVVVAAENRMVRLNRETLWTSNFRLDSLVACQFPNPTEHWQKRFHEKIQSNVI